MGTTAEKLAYLAETKEEIAAAIEEQGVPVDEDDTFLSYADKIRSISTTVIQEVPTQSGALTYTGTAQTPTWSDYDSSLMTMGGDTVGTDAGTYTTTFTPNFNCIWYDNSEDAKSVTWSIGKAAGGLPLAPSTLSLDSDTTTGTVSVTRSGDGAITAVSSDTNVATVSVSGTTVTVTAIGSGSATITVSVAEGSNHLAATGATCAVTTVGILPPIGGTLNSYSWLQIREIAQAGCASDYFEVGDTKEVLVSGTVGTLAVNETLLVYIIDIDHDDNTNTIDFGTFKSSDGLIDVAMIDDNYNVQVTSGGLYFNMQHTSDEWDGGWEGCDMRYSILGSTDTNEGAPSATTATNPVANTLMAALPTDLRAVMVPMTIYTDNDRSGNSNSGSWSDTVSATDDYLPLLSEFEVFGERDNSNSYEDDYQTQYAYFANGNSATKNQHSPNTTSAVWWLRSPCTSMGAGGEYGCTVKGSGSASGYSRVRYSYGVAPIFRVG